MIDNHDLDRGRHGLKFMVRRCSVVVSDAFDNVTTGKSFANADATRWTCSTCRHGCREEEERRHLQDERRANDDLPVGPSAVLAEQRTQAMNAALEA
jgi:hypothetical protein